MQDLNTNRIIETLSLERIEAYQQDGASNETALMRYTWNMALCQSLYPCLQLCEISLRNSIHFHLTKTYGEEWFDCTQLTLTPWGQKQVKQTKELLSRMKKPITPGRVVAELQFGFWTHLLESHYEGSFGYLPKGIKGIFPHLPKSEHNRKKLKAKLDKIRGLRNRVFHHERIIHWKDLREQHALILTMINNISPDTKTLCDKLDSFADLHSNGYDKCLKQDIKQ
ncbi:MAG: hypothetical protein U9N57_09515 [Pseudomonadota bacterium]|nr:hypothetical protein [Pseudomonadota bacterium]